VSALPVTNRPADPKATLRALPAIELGGVRLHAITEAQCVAHVDGELAAGRGGWIVTANLDHLRRLRSAADFQACYAAADVAVADGMPLVWAARLQGTPLPARVAGSDLIFSLSAMAGTSRRRVFFLGGDPGTADAAAAQLAAQGPGLVVAGTDCPAFGFERDPAALAALRARLAASAAELVFVALGSPKQELLIAQLRGVLPQAWWIGIGISFSFVTGDVVRAPRWLQRLGLEWLHRLVQEPRRLAKRYLVHGLPFAAWLFAASLRSRWTGAGRGNGAAGAA
jgi:N-acetylglucosaminyldiphosphoundecaprenol N-acetyl-beta-D-mannosaminyltransferase